MERVNRLYRGGILLSQILRARIMKKSMPINVYLLVTNRCNLGCFYCYVRPFERQIEDFPLELIFKIIDKVVSFGTRYIIIEGGEPLLRDDIGQIIDYIKKKMAVCEMITNGHFIEDKIEQVRKLDSLCISIDGDEQANDLIRGKGSHHKTMKGLKLALDNKIHTRIHAVLTRYNYHCLDYLVKLAKETGTTLTISPPSIHTAHEAIKFSDDEIRKFFIKILEYKRQGYPIGSSYYSLKYVINWPFPYNCIIHKNDPLGNFKILQCQLGHLSCNVDANGMVYPCSCLFHKYGKSLFEFSIKEIWDYFGRLDCISCGHVNQVEQTLIFSANFKSLLNAAKFYIIPSIFRKKSLEYKGSNIISY